MAKKKSGTQRAAKGAPAPDDAPLRNTRARKNSTNDREHAASPINPDDGPARPGTSGQPDPVNEDSSRLTSVTPTESQRWSDRPEFDNELPDASHLIKGSGDGDKEQVTTDPTNESTSTGVDDHGSSNAMNEDTFGERRALATATNRNEQSLAIEDVMGEDERNRRRKEKRRRLPEDKSPQPSNATFDSDTRAYVDANFPKEAAQRLRLRIREEAARLGRPLTAGDMETIIEEGLLEVIQDRQTYYLR
ncbi:hypothetical protein BD626DRAFT_566287 [Schizophyllum amplum]|uniref:Uncharacterized protein n=1 Tax=Schizophyllum amplum TaxID=97359 RepID=A0A550CR76_9AGAR|nr:hypothetical protein BD626DRAFT_566287 [Auriculariopsis ampla]